MLKVVVALFCALITASTFVAAQQQCYFAPGAAGRGPNNLVPCLDSGTSACCLLGDTCLSGNTCYNYATGDLYQYGCTDITYEADVCPYKCGWNATLSPWTALEYCQDVNNVEDTWTCHAPESCGCSWNASESLLVLSPRGCKEMGTDARVALYAPSTLAPFVSLPSTVGGPKTYYSGTTINGTSTWVSTAILGYTPSSIGPLTTYANGPASVVLIVPGVTPAPSTVAAPLLSSASGAPDSSAPPSTSSSSISATTTAPSTTAPAAATTSSSSSSGLSSDAVTGIGVGVGVGGAGIIAAVAVTAFFWGRSRRKRRAQDTQNQSQQPQNYPGSPPMQQQQQTSPYYPSPGEKPPGWQYPMGHPQFQQQPPYYDQHNQPSLYGDVQPMYGPGGGMPSPPLDARKQTQSPPMELAADTAHPMEMENAPVQKPPTPAPAYYGDEHGSPSPR